MKLVDLPGVGPRLRERLREHYGDEEKALKAVRDGDLLGLCSTLSERQALQLVQYARALKFRVSPDEFLATDEAVRIYSLLISRLAGFAHTEYARLKIGTLFPSSSQEMIEENRLAASHSLEVARRMEGLGLEEQLRSIRPLRERSSSRVRERAVAASSAEDFQRLKSRGLDRLIDLHLAESPQELLALARSYSVVSLVGEGMVDAEEVERAESLEDWYLVPEAVLGFYRENMETLAAAVEAALKLRAAGVEDFEDWEDFFDLISRLSDKSDLEAERLSRLAARLERSVDQAASAANEELKRRIEQSSLTLDGTDLLQVMSRGDGIRELFEIRMKGIYQEILKEAKERAREELDLKGAEEVWLDEIFSSAVSYPLELDRRALRSFEQELRSRQEERGLKAKRELARGLADERNRAETLVHILMEFDYSYALGSFTLKEGLSFPEIASETGLCFQGARNLSLEQPEKVSYCLGGGPGEPPEMVALLSGVNSGGKTTLLDLISQIVILAQMGLPVPADSCRMGLFEQLYYFSKSRGTLSAGAFETAMRKFAVVENEKRKLVLADELESITEPGASARIIACMLDELNRRGSAAVFVSHLAEDVRRFSETPVRVDGIEAEGLDENNCLVVCRSPRYNYLAKSTPELILDRLVRTTKGQEKEFYSRLLGKFR